MDVVTPDNLRVSIEQLKQSLVREAKRKDSQKSLVYQLSDAEEYVLQVPKENSESNEGSKQLYTHTNKRYQAMIKGKNLDT